MKKILIVITFILLLTGCGNKESKTFNEIKDVNFKSKIVEDRQMYEIGNYEKISKLMLEYEELLLKNDLQIDGIKFVNRAYQTLGSTKDVDFMLKDDTIHRFIFDSNEKLLRIEIDSNNIDNYINIITNYSLFKDLSTDQKNELNNLSNLKRVDINNYTFYLQDKLLIVNNG